MRRLARNLSRGGSRPDLEVLRGERLLAWAATSDGAAVGGTRDALYLPGGTRIAWEDVESADWDADTATLRVSEVGSWGEQRPEHHLVLDDPTRFLQLVRERVTASVVLQRHVALEGRRGVRVIGRRAPGAVVDSSRISWVHEYDEGIDPHDPHVRLAAAQALEAAREELGLA